LKAGAARANGANDPNATTQQAAATADACTPGPTLIQKPTKGSIIVAKQAGSHVRISF
jgi:hypothetical protein